MCDCQIDLYCVCINIHTVLLTAIEFLQMSWRINTQPQLNILSGGLLVNHGMLG